MALLKLKGDRAEIEVARDLIKRGFRVAIPYGEDWDFDLIFARPDHDDLERVQVKYAESRDGVLPVRCCSHSLTNGRVRQTKKYTARPVDWMAMYDLNTDRCYYVPSSLLGADGRRELSLRLRPTRNGQRIGVWFADDFVDPEPRQALLEMEPAGLEPAPSDLQSPRSPN